MHLDFIVVSKFTQNHDHRMIQPATASDLSAIAQLVNSAYRGEHSRKGWTTETDLIDGNRIDAEALEELSVRPDTTILKFERDGRIVGCVELQKNGHRLYVGMLSVEPSIQGGGIGKQLLAAAEDEAHRLGCSHTFMTVISVRRELLAWYLRHGYVDTGERIPFHHNDVRFGIPRQALELAVLEKFLKKKN